MDDHMVPTNATRAGDDRRFRRRITRVHHCDHQSDAVTSRVKQTVRDMRSFARWFQCPCSDTNVAFETLKLLPLAEALRTLRLCQGMQNPLSPHVRQLLQVSNCPMPRQLETLEQRARWGMYVAKRRSHERNAGLLGTPLIATGVRALAVYTNLGAGQNQVYEQFNWRVGHCWNHGIVHWGGETDHRLDITWIPTRTEPPCKVTEVTECVDRTRVLDISVGHAMLVLTEAGMVYAAAVHRDTTKVFPRQLTRLAPIWPTLRVVAVACGDSTNFMLSSCGKVISFGTGWLGHARNTETEWSAPAVVAALVDKNIIAISAGGRCAAAVDDRGDVYTWGADDCALGQPRVPSETPEHSRAPRQIDRGFRVPTKVEAFCRHRTQSGTGFVTTVSMSSNDKTTGTVASGHAFAIDRNGCLWSWGCNLDGQLGIGTCSPQQRSPVLLPTPRRRFVVSVCHTC